MYACRLDLLLAAVHVSICRKFFRKQHFTLFAKTWPVECMACHTLVNLTYTMCSHRDCTYLITTADASTAPYTGTLA